MRRDIPRANPFILAAAGLSAVCLAGYIYSRLGDYTAERGLLAFLQIAGVSGAFGALVLLVLEAARHAVERPPPKD